MAIHGEESTRLCASSRPASWDESGGVPSASDIMLEPGERIRYELSLPLFDEDVQGENGHVKIRVLVSLPPTYPNSSPPQLQLLGRYVGQFPIDAGLCEFREKTGLTRQSARLLGRIFHLQEYRSLLATYVYLKVCSTPSISAGNGTRHARLKVRKGIKHEKRKGKGEETGAHLKACIQMMRIPQRGSDRRQRGPHSRTLTTTQQKLRT